MRLWHQEILEFLPKGQLLAQWRELNSVFAKEDKHILINYIYEYDKNELWNYTQLVMNEMETRGYKIRTKEKYENYFKDIKKKEKKEIYQKHHTDEYLEICYFNLKEKCIRGQKDFEEWQMNGLEKKYKETKRNNK